MTVVSPSQMPYKFSLRGPTHVTGTFKRAGVTGTFKRAGVTGTLQINTGRIQRVAAQGKLEKSSLSNLTMKAVINDIPQMIKTLTVGSWTATEVVTVYSLEYTFNTHKGFKLSATQPGGGESFGDITPATESGVEITALRASKGMASALGGGGGDDYEAYQIEVKIKGDTSSRFTDINLGYYLTSETDVICTFVNYDTVNDESAYRYLYTRRGSATNNGAYQLYAELENCKQYGDGIHKISVKLEGTAINSEPDSTSNTVQLFDLMSMNLQPTDTITIYGVFTSFSGMHITKTAQEWADLQVFDYYVRPIIRASLWNATDPSKDSIVTSTPIYDWEFTEDGYVYINEAMAPKWLKEKKYTPDGLNCIEMATDFASMSAYNVSDPIILLSSGPAGTVQLNLYYISASISKSDCKVFNSEFWNCGYDKWIAYAPDWDRTKPLNTKSATMTKKLFTDSIYSTPYGSILRLNLTNVWNAEETFHAGDSITSTGHEILPFDSSNWITARGLFKKRKDLATVPYFYTGNIQDFSNMFLESSITSIPWVIDMKNAATATDMFKGCTGLGSVTLKNVPEHITTQNMLGGNTTTVITIQNTVPTTETVTVDFRTTSDSAANNFWSPVSFSVKVGTKVPQLYPIPELLDSTYRMEFYWNMEGTIPINFEVDTFTTEHKVIYAKFIDTRPLTTCRFKCLDATNGQQLAVGAISANYKVEWGYEAVDSQNAATSNGTLDFTNVPVTANWVITVEMFTSEPNTHNLVYTLGTKTRVSFNYIPSEGEVNEIVLFCLPNAKQGEAIIYQITQGVVGSTDGVYTFRGYSDGDTSVTGIRRPAYGTFIGPEPRYLKQVEYGTEEYTTGEYGNSWVDIFVDRQLILSTNPPMGTLLGCWVSPVTDANVSKNQWKFVSTNALTQPTADGKFTSGSLASVQPTPGINYITGITEGTNLSYCFIVALAI